MIDKLFICYETLSRFQQDLNAGNIKSTSIVFIEETHQIYTNGTYYGEFDNSIGPNGGLSNDQHLILSSDQIKWLFTTFANLNGLQTPWVEYTISYTGDTDAFLVNGNAVPQQGVTISGGSFFSASISAVSGYAIEEVTYSIGGNSYTIDEPDQQGYWKVTIPAVTSNVVINVVTTDKPYKLYLNASQGRAIGEVASYTASSERFAEGDSLTLQIQAKPGFALTGYTLNGTTVDQPGPYSISVNDIQNDVYVTVEYSNVEYTVTLSNANNCEWYEDQGFTIPVNGNSITYTHETDRKVYVKSTDTNFQITGIGVNQSGHNVGYTSSTHEVIIYGSNVGGFTIETIGQDITPRFNITTNHPTGVTFSYKNTTTDATIQPTNILEGTPVTVTISTTGEYQINSIQVVGENTSVDNQTHVVTISSMVSNVTITVNASIPQAKYYYGGFTKGTTVNANLIEIYGTEFTQDVNQTDNISNSAFFVAYPYNKTQPTITGLTMNQQYNSLGSLVQNVSYSEKTYNVWYYETPRGTNLNDRFKIILN